MNTIRLLPDPKDSKGPVEDNSNFYDREEKWAKEGELRMFTDDATRVFATIKTS